MEIQDLADDAKAAENRMKQKVETHFEEERGFSKKKLDGYF